MAYVTRGERILQLSLRKTREEKIKTSQLAVAEWVHSCRTPTPTPSSRKRRRSGLISPTAWASAGEFSLYWCVIAALVKLVAFSTSLLAGMARYLPI